MKRPRQKTEEEVRTEFLAHVRGLVEYWHDVEGRDPKDKLNGLAFSIMAAIDGCSVDIPAFILAPFPHEEDKKYSISKRNNYYPENHKSNVKCDIAGSLHDNFYKK